MGNLCKPQTPKHDLRANMMRIRTGTDIDEVYSFEKGLGEGSMGAVAAIKKKSTGQMHVLKTIQMSRVSKEMRDELRNEINLLMQLDHPNIVTPLELFERKRQMYFVMDFCSGGDLYTRMPYTEEKCARYMNQICSAVRYLHSKNVCHRDLKFENIMFESKDDNAMVILIDFGLSKAYKPGQVMSETVGTLYSMAPEVLTGTSNELSDIWSIGCLTYMMLSGFMPFDSKSEAIVVRKIQKGDYHFKQAVWEGIGQGAKDFINACLKVDPTERPSAAQLQEQPWLLTWWNKDQGMKKQLSGRSIDVNGNGNVGSDAGGCGGDGTGGSGHRASSFKEDQGHAIVSSLQQFGTYGKLRKAALMVVAHRAEHSQIHEMRDAFLEFDTAKEGHISLDELQAVLSRYNMLPAEVAEIFKGIDVAGSGRIEYTEFLAATVEAKGLNLETELLEAFDRMDADDSGYISEANLRELLGTAYKPNEVKEMIAEADLKRNGRVDLEEFLALMGQKRNKEVVDMKETLPTVAKPEE